MLYAFVLLMLQCSSTANIWDNYKDYTPSNRFNRRILGEFQEAPDDQFFWFLSLKFPFLSSGTPKIGSGRSNLYIGRWSRGVLTPQRAGTKHFCDLEAQDDQLFGHFGPFFSIGSSRRVIERCASSRRILRKKYRPKRT